MHSEIYSGIFKQKEVKFIHPIWQDLIANGETIDIGEWQSRTINQKMVELLDQILLLDIPETAEDLIELVDPDLPWAEDHFQERIGGKTINPGNQYMNWPYYLGKTDDGRFRSNGKEMKFDHSYMERFWPPFIKGIRYSLGNLDDIIERLKINPYTRQAYLSIWHPEDQSNDKIGKRVPCTLGYHFQIRNNELRMTYHIRSCDAVRHFKNDVYMAGRLMQYVATKTGVKVGKLSMYIGNLHCFESDLYSMKKQLK
jgi:hypothetical protein